MGSKTWGTPQIIKEYLVVGENDEIPSGHKAYVFNKQTSAVSDIARDTWEAFIAGDLTELKNRIESDIPNSRVIWLKVSWTKAHLYGMPGGGFWYAVEGFYVEAIVENTGGAALTGLEIAAIIIAIGFLAAVLIPLLTGTWITWEVVQSVKGALGDLGMIGVGLLLLVGIAVFLLLVLGVGFKGKGIAVGR